MPEGLLASLHSAEFIEAVQQETEGYTGWAPTTSPPSPTCTNTPSWSAATLAVTQAVYREGRPTTGSTSPAGCTTRCLTAPPVSAYNDVATSIKWLLDQGVERVAYVDVDVHHGDGVQQHFWDDRGC